LHGPSAIAELLVNLIITHTHTHPFNGSFSRTTRVSLYQKGKTNLDFTEARGSGISGAMCKSASRSRQITTPAPHHSSFLQAGCPSCRPTNSVKALKAIALKAINLIINKNISVPILTTKVNAECDKSATIVIIVNNTCDG